MSRTRWKGNGSRGSIALRLTLFKIPWVAESIARCRFRCASKCCTGTLHRANEREPASPGTGSTRRETCAVSAIAGCLCFRANRLSGRHSLSTADFLHTFFICFLPILIVFYPSLVLSFNIFKEGAIDSPAVLWTPIILLTLVSIPLNRRAIWS